MPLGRNFTKAVVASGFANLADGVLWVALPLLAVQLTRSPLLIAGITVANRIPWLLAPVAGAFADRLDRRQSMVRVNLVRTVLLGGLALAVAADLATLPMLYAVAVLLGVAETLFDTSAQSLLPALVDRDDLTRANSRLYAVELVANTIIGPPLGGLLAAAGLAVALGLPAAAYLVGAAFLALIAGSFRAAGAGPAGSTRLRDEIAEGAGFVWRHPVLRPLAIMLGIENMAFAAAFAVFVLFAVAPGPMGLSEAGYGILSATLGVGSLLGTWVAVPAERRLGRVHTLVVSVVLMAASLVVPALTANAVLVGVSFALSGVAIVLWNVVTVSLRQRITPDRLLGRMNAAYRLVGWGTMPVGAALGGFLAEALGLRPTFVISAALTLAVLPGFRLVTEEAIAEAEAPAAPTG
ncbi:MAG TPA: MFS transporter, partial [Actinomycetota bacterium]|nr:MFS transporter [Actinomycetota bacterium]